jgi:acyl-CoA synthetase (AMP-forming)/AMP-acid ligase II
VPTKVHCSRSCGHARFLFAIASCSGDGLRRECGIDPSAHAQLAILDATEMALTVPLVHADHTASATLVDILRYRALQQRDQRLYTFLRGDDAESLTHGELDARVRSLAAVLIESCNPGDRVLLLYPPGLDYIVALYACMYAGVIAVPAYLPRPNRPLTRLESIIADCQPAIALTSGEILNSPRSIFRQQSSPIAQLRALATENTPPITAFEPKGDISGKTPVILQYTSGSTASPRGVVLTHANIVHNTAMIQQNFPLDPESSTVFWLPPYHDMGLIGGILQPLCTGFPVTLMSPVAFLQRPARWLQAISRFRATCSGGPNFAYDLCVRGISEEEKDGLDLSSWSVAFSGAEPIRKETLDEFSAAFARCGFRRESLHPCYGLAEATLMATGIAPAEVLKFETVSRSAMEQNHVEPAGDSGDDEYTLVSCGRAAGCQEVRIVDPVSCEPCVPGGIGEVWIAGPNVALGYWGRPEKTEETFRAALASGEGSFLRTGDLGFMRDGELYITGRIKDLIIIHGQNHYPHDIEFTAQRSHPLLKPSSTAAFSVPGEGGERLVIVQELRSGAENAAEVIVNIGRAVRETHDIQVEEVVVVRMGAIPRTTSGKIQRYLCRAAYLAGSLAGETSESSRK